MKKLLILLTGLLLSASLYAERPIIQDIQAKASKGTKINVYWTLPKNPDEKISKYVLYRSTKPVYSYYDLKDAQKIADLTPDSTGYTDSVKDYKDYFYTVISYTNKPYEYVLVSVNTTATGVHLIMKEKPAEQKKTEPDEKLYKNGTMRETPLPFLDLLSGMDEEEEQISEESIEAVALLSDKKKNSSAENFTPYFFEEDLISPDGGDDYLLFTVLKNTFVQEKYEQALNQLQTLVKRNISAKVLNRAYFYMGEAYFFLGNYEEAVIAFIHVAQTYPVETSKWINKSLDSIYIYN